MYAYTLLHPPPLGEAGGVGITGPGEEGWKRREREERGERRERRERRERWWMCHKRKFNTETL